LKEIHFVLAIKYALYFLFLTPNIGIASALRCIELPENGQSSKWAEFQYVAVPVTYEQTYTSKVNARTLELMKERTLAANKEEKAAAIKELKNQVQENLKGSLFENDTSQLDNIRLGMPQPKTKKPTTKKIKIEQPKLF